MHIGIKGTMIAGIAALLVACSPANPGPTVTSPTTTPPSSTAPSTTQPPTAKPSTTAAPPTQVVTPSPTTPPPVKTTPPPQVTPTTKPPVKPPTTKPSSPPPVSGSYNKYGCGNADSKVLLVFDDYPLSSTAFKSLIDVAKQNGIGIGVAPNGEYVQSGRAPVSYARSAGMLVVDHTYDHKDLTTLSVSGMTWEITRPYVDSNYVRPPYGAENATVRSVLAQNHKYDCLWNLDPRDWDGRSPQAAANYIIANAQPGSTAVVHMNHLGTQPSLLPYIKAGLAKRGIAMCAPWSTPTTPIMPAVYCR